MLVFFIAILRLSHVFYDLADATAYLWTLCLYVCELAMDEMK